MVPFCRAVSRVSRPVLNLLGNVPQHIWSDRVLIPIGAEQTDDRLGLLEEWDDAVEQDPVEAMVSESNAMLVMLLESVHGPTPVW